MPLPASTAIAPTSLEAPGRGLHQTGSPSAAPGAGAETFRTLLETAEAGVRVQSPALLEGPPAARGVGPPASEALEAFYHRAQEGSRALDSVIAEARAGRTFSSQELIGLQARIYRSTLIVETFSKVVESTSNGARQLLGTNL